MLKETLGLISILFLIQNVLIEINCGEVKEEVDEQDQKGGWGNQYWGEPPPQWNPQQQWTPPLINQPLDCDNEIYCKCHTQQTFTKEELENVKRYLQYRWYYEASAKPVREPCKQIYVRKNWKCLSTEERTKFVRAFRILYETGVMNAIGEFHQRWWPATHKTVEFYPFHVAVTLVMERELWRVDPTLPGLPYWDSTTDFAQPHKSCIWKDMGYGGIYRNGYCVRTGTIFGNNLQIDFQPRCLKRVWQADGTMAPTYSGELETVWIQVYQTLPGFMFSLSAFHYFHHLSVGGWEGDNGQTIAANDIAFIMTHSDFYRTALLWQLQEPSKLTPVEGYMDPVFKLVDPITGQFKPSNPYDKMHFVNRSQVEFLQYGYGDMCFIYDTMVDPINRIVKGEPARPPPNSVTRLINTLPPDMLKKYYPYFAAGRTDFTTHKFEYLPECNVPKCKPMPFFQRYNDTIYGRRQNAAYRLPGYIDLFDVAQQYQHYWWTLMMDLNSVRYCSPAVNT